MRILLFLFVLLPIVEIFVLIKVGGAIGTGATIALILLTAFVGAGLLRQQGVSTMVRAQSKMSHGALPAHEMVEGLFLAVGGALLLTPGFITDIIGFCCLVPGLRHFLILWGQKHLSVTRMNTHFSAGSSGDQSSVHSRSQKSEAQKSSGGDTHIIDGEFEREE